MNEYLIGEIYWIQNSHTGKSSLFLNKPPNNMNGRMNTGITIGINAASDIEHPNSNPNEFPANEIKKKIRKNIKNCPAVAASPAMKYIMTAMTRGMTTKNGSSTRLLDK